MPKFSIIIIGIIIGIIGLGFYFQWPFVTQYWIFFLFLLCPLMHSLSGHGHGEQNKKDVGKSCHSTSQWAKANGLFFGVFFIVCFLWSFVLTDPVLKELHMNLFRMTFPGFSSMNAVSFIVGTIESVVLGLIVGWGISTCLNKFSK